MPSLLLVSVSFTAIICYGCSHSSLRLIGASIPVGLPCQPQFSKSPTCCRPQAFHISDQIGSGAVALFTSLYPISIETTEFRRPYCPPLPVEIITFTFTSITVAKLLSMGHGRKTHVFARIQSFPWEYDALGEIKDSSTA